MPRAQTSKMTQLTLTGQPVSATTTTTKKKGKKGEVTRVYTDVVLSIKPEFVRLMADRLKNHEYRKYKLRPTVERLWLYEVEPIMAITHVVRIGAPRVPGEVNDPSGIGNDDFDAGKKVSKYGYPVKEMYRLHHPLPNRVLKEKYGIAPPQAYLHAPEVLVKGEPIAGMEVLYKVD